MVTHGPNTATTGLNTETTRQVTVVLNTESLTDLTATTGLIHRVPHWHNTATTGFNTEPTRPPTTGYIISHTSCFHKTRYRQNPNKNILHTTSHCIDKANQNPTTTWYMTSLTFPLHHLHDPEVYIAQAKSQRRANTLVFGLLPLNRLAPDNPGRINHSDRGSSSTSDTKSVGYFNELLPLKRQKSI